MGTFRFRSFACCFTSGRRNAYIISIFCIVLFSFAAAQNVCAYDFPEERKAREAAGSGMDVVIVVDISGSMQYTDPDHMADEAAMLFLDMLQEEDCQAALLVFSDTVQVIRELQPLSMDQEREGLREQLLNSGRGKDTDIGAALFAAVDQLKDSCAGRKAVLLFTDGEVDLPDPEEADRSLRQAHEAAALAAESGISFYTAGLDDLRNTSGYHLDRELMEELAEESGGSFYPVGQADELPDLFHRVFSEYIETRTDRIGDLYAADDGFSSLCFTVPDSSVVEANVILLPDLDDEDVQESPDRLYLYDPDGNECIADTEKVKLRNSPGYTLLKLIGPEQGEWTLEAYGETGFHVHVNLLFQYEITLECEVLPDEEQNACVRVWFSRKGKRITDPLLYGQFLCTVLAEYEEMPPEGWTENGSGAKISCPAKVSGSGDGYLCVIPVYPGRTVRISAEAEGEVLSKKAETVRFTSEKSDAIIVNRLPERLTIEGMFPKEARAVLDAAGVFRAWDGTGVLVTAVSQDEEILVIVPENGGRAAVGAEEAGTAEPGTTETDMPETGAMESGMSDIGQDTTQRWILKGKHSGECMIRLTARDRYGNEVFLEIPVRIVIRRNLLIYAAGVFAVILILLACIFLSLRRRKLPSIRLKTKRSGQMNGALVLMRNAFTEGEKEYVCILSGLSGRYPLSRLPGSAFGGPDGSLFDGREQEILSQVIISGIKRGHTGDMIRIRNHSGDCILADCYGRPAERIRLQDGDTFEIRFPLTREQAETDRRADLPGRTGYRSVFGCYIREYADN